MFKTANTLLIIVAAGIIGLLCFSIGLAVWGMWHDEWSGYNASLSVSDGVCNIAVIPVIGEITSFAVGEDELNMTNADDVRMAIEWAESDPVIEGLMLRIDSYGGTPVASEVIADAVAVTPLPTAALIREGGTSGAYLAASAADTVIASPFSDVGGIGISMSYLDTSELNRREGIEFVSLASAPYKDYGTPERPLTVQERVLLERDLELYHNYFVESVAKNRGLPADTVAALADGASMPGTLALERGLVDSLGNQETARQWFAATLGRSADEIIFCEW